MIKVGLTGSMGSGKDTVVSLLSDYPDVLTTDSDLVCRELWKWDHQIHDKIFKVFGTIDKKEVEKITFDDPEKRKLLENIFHPIINCYQEWIYDSFKKWFKMMIFNSPLLFERGNHKKMDVNITLITDRYKALQRLQKSDKELTLEDFEKRLAVQMSDKEKISLSDIVIYNNGGKKELDKQIEKAYNYILFGRNK